MNEKEEMKTTFDGGISEEQIKQWKAKHRKVVRIDVVDDGELHIGYFHRPTMETMQAAAKVGKTDQVKSGQVLFDGTWLGGSEYLRNDSVLFLATMHQLNKVFNSCMSSIKNL